MNANSFINAKAAGQADERAGAHFYIHLVAYMWPFKIRMNLVFECMNTVSKNDNFSTKQIYVIRIVEFSKWKCGWRSGQKKINKYRIEMKQIHHEIGHCSSLNLLRSLSRCRAATILVTVHACNFQWPTSSIMYFHASGFTFRHTLKVKMK